jgi:Domain of unknown function (DUF4835)
MSKRASLIAVLIGFMFFVPLASAQEFNCSVSVNYNNLTGNDYTFLDELRENVREYINERRWTEDTYQAFERIDCTLQILFTEAVTLTRFRARLILASRRPIYNSAQQTTVVQFNDENWIFDYTRGSPLVYQPDRFNAITSVLNFYANIMLGYDYDTFSEFGGTPYFEAARRVSEIAQSAGSVGWTQLGGKRSRGELIAQALDSRFSDLRKIYFDYHLEALDKFVSDPDAARRQILNVVDRLERIYTDVSRAYYLDQFFTAKYQEMTAVFEGSSVASQAYDKLSRIDPSHLSNYSTMLQ